MNPQDSGLTIQRCANGFIVTGRVSWQHDGPPDGPPAWYAFETYDALEKHLREKLAGVPAT